MKSCKITFIDEVNARIDGLDNYDKHHCEEQLKYLVPWRFHTPSFKLKRWDGAIRFFSNNRIYISLLPKIMPYIMSKGYEIDFEDNRVGGIEVPEIGMDIFAEYSWPDDHRFAGEPIMLREDQMEAANIFAKHHYALQELSTGYGKTILTAAICKQVEHLGRTITIVPSKSLVKQTYNDFLMVGLDAGMYFSDEKTTDTQHIITTWQSLSRLLENYNKSRDAKIILDELSEGVVQFLVDEAHSAKSQSLDKLLSKHFNNIPLRRGFTGTVPKEEYFANTIIGNIGEVVHRVTAKELQEKGFLAECDIVAIETELPTERVFETYHQEYNYLVSDWDMMDYYRDLTEIISQSGNTIILVERVETGEYLEDNIEGSKFVSGSMSLKKREEIFKSVHESDNCTIIATYGVAAVGINIPRLYNVIMVEAGKSFVRVIQTIGRGLRKAKDKSHATIWDLSGATKFSKKHAKSRFSYYEDAEYPCQKMKGTVTSIKAQVSNHIKEKKDG